MSGLAAVLLNNGYKVSGSDFKESKIIETLRSKGAEIYIGHSAENLKDVDLVVYTAAIPSDNPEITPLFTALRPYFAARRIHCLGSNLS